MAFAKLAVGAKAASMGHASTSIEDDAYGQPRNAALLATLKKGRIGSQTAFFPSGQDLQHLSFGRPIDLKSSWSYGLFYTRSSFGKALERRSSNTPDADSTFSEGSYVIGAGLAAWLWPQRLAAGANVKLYNQSLGDASGGGYGVDFGLHWRSLDHLTMGLSVQDLSNRIGWNTGLSEQLPTVFRVAACMDFFEERLLLSTDTEKSQAQDVRLRLGSELWVWQDILAMRGGWNQGYWSLGLGIRAQLWSSSSDAGFDYALVQDPLGDGAFQHRFSIDMGFALE